MNKAKNIDNSKNTWDANDDLKDFYSIYQEDIHKLRYFIFEHRKILDIYQPIAICKSKVKDIPDVYIFTDYVYSRLEFDNKYNCSKYQKSINYIDLLYSGEFKDLCLSDVNKLYNRDNEIMEHWNRTLYKLETSLKFWINIRIPKILKKEISQNSSNQYKRQKSMKEKKLYIDTILKKSVLLDKSRLAFIYLAEIRDLITKIVGQLNKFTGLDLNTSVGKKCKDLKIRDNYIMYYNIWPNKLQVEDQDDIANFFENLLGESEDNTDQLTTPEAMRMNDIYNKYLNWFAKYKKEKLSDVSQQILNEMSPNYYINLARGVSKTYGEKFEKKNFKKKAPLGETSAALRASAALQAGGASD
tara:strand:- start:450 stop:1520 length:1071 start_codon:yes stop_codon:yes gene_type:complete